MVDMILYPEISEIMLILKKFFLPAIIIILIASTFTGCTAATSRGWAGFTENSGILYYATMDGKAVAINPSLRSTNATFPGEREWSYTFKLPATGGGFCGPSCTSSAPVGMVLYSTPATSRDLAFYATYSGRVYAFNLKTGSDRWVYPRESTDSIGPVVGNITMDRDTLYLSSSYGTILALDAATGDKLWVYTAGEKIWTTPVISEGVVYTGSYDGKFHAISSNNGTGLWQIKLPTAVSSSPAIWKNTVIFGCFDHTLLSLNRNDGSIKWSFTGPNWFWSTPVIANDVVYASNIDRKIFALNADTGKELWQFIGDSSFTATPVVVNNTLVAVSDLGTLYIINTADGSLKQDVSLGFQTVAPVCTVDNIVYVHTKDDFVHAVNVADGKETWKFKYVEKQENK